MSSSQHSNEGGPSFPLVDAILITPEEAANGSIGICTNSTMAPGQVYGEVDSSLTHHTAVYGSLKVNRDGAERLILNSLVHPTMSQVVLFGTETSSFRPSTNMLQALQYGIDPSDDNSIINGQTKSAQYPNLSVDLMDMFRDRITVLPIFMSETNSQEVVQSYLDWISSRIDKSTEELLREINSRPNKIYYDSLNKLIAHLGNTAVRSKPQVILNPADFQQLQPPIKELNGTAEKITAPFEVSIERDQICVKLILDGQTLVLKESNPFLLGYSLMKHIGEKKELLSSLQQLALGAEVARASTELNNGVVAESFISSPEHFGSTVLVETEPIVRLKTDSKYYYMVSIKDDKKISVQCMAHDQCEEVYELRADNATTLLERIAKDNRFEEYEMDFLHRYDVGMQIGRADIASNNDYEFVQDFDNIFKVNHDTLPFLTIESDSFLAAHQALLRRIYTEGLTEEHGDRAKGLARTAAALVVWRASEKSLAQMERIYKQGDRSTEVIRRDYRDQLLRFDHDGTYSYGERTRAYFGHDQLESAVMMLNQNPNDAFIVQRFDPTHDMAYGIDPETNEPRSSEDPCLTHDIYFIVDGKLQSLHIARAHNAVNAYPENIFGLHDAYDSTIAAQLDIELGDMFMLSNRANILLLTEEQKAQKIMSMPAKPMDYDYSVASGPYVIGENTKLPEVRQGVAYTTQPIEYVTERPDSQFLDKIEDMNGVNTLTRAIEYLTQKGASHNNPVLSSFTASEDDPQGEHLAFFQANILGGKLHATVVFANRSIEDAENDIMLANYITTKYKQGLGNVSLGGLTFISVGFK